MQMAHIFGLPAALLILAFVANRLSKLTRIPDIIVLLLIGITLGPILHWVDPRIFKALSVSLALWLSCSFFSRVDSNSGFARRCDISPPAWSWCY